MDDRSPQTLLADARWVRRLALRLVHDPDIADEVSQETLVASLRRPRGSRRSWLASVARNIASTLVAREARRGAVERAAEPRGAAPPTDKLVAEVELQRAAVDALMELDEPYRRTLLLRFMTGLSVGAVARRMQVPLETVRTRQKRGLSQLRVRLRRQMEDYRAWLLPLAVPGWPVPTIVSFWGFVLMNWRVPGSQRFSALFSASRDLLCLELELAIAEFDGRLDPLIHQGLE